MSGYHDVRFAPDPRREVLWRTLWRHHFAARIGAADCVLDLGAGYGSFINQVVARRRIAVDTWAELPRHVAPGVEAVVGSVADLGFLPDGAVDFAFASNLFEHLTQADFAATLAGLRRVLSPRGTLTILQPNWRHASREYYDDYTHVTPWSHVSLCDFLAAHGFEPFEVRPRFLPLTIKSRLPVHPLLIRAWLASPLKPGGKQMLVAARPRRS
ncbi:methyltransferase type 11 [Falsiroseomonas bella]|uniref:Methyltransferase type 11 n=1 Tax=Falsiroseomonas bella TaxID=2184016 RepID=A0A317FJZ1_9PROT|nr:class I SAM-dependent methyltransferase [Falsiroseomonas bella]PWS38652.1 methyltransferase type 11 [Falsiroseomonas bella]